MLHKKDQQSLGKVFMYMKIRFGANVASPSLYIYFIKNGIFLFYGNFVSYECRNASKIYL